MKIQPTSPKRPTLEDAVFSATATIDNLIALLENPVRVSLKSVDDYIEIGGLGSFSHADCILLLDPNMKQEVLRALN